LIKPQFEAGRDKVGKKGVVRDKAIHMDVIEDICNFCQNQLHLSLKGLTFSPIKGPEGNIEYLVFFDKKSEQVKFSVLYQKIINIVNKAHEYFK